MKTIVCLSLVLPALNSSAQGFIISFVTANGDGSYTYEYEVDNRTTTFEIFQWSLELSLEKSVRDWNPLDITFGGDVVVPLGSSATFSDDWEAVEGPDFAGGFTQDFRSIDPLGSGDVQIGDRLGGFSFISAIAPGQVAYTVFGPAGEFSTGFTTGPAFPIPEPSAPLLTLSVAILALRHRRRS